MCLVGCQTLLNQSVSVRVMAGIRVVVRNMVSGSQGKSLGGNIQGRNVLRPSTRHLQGYRQSDSWHAALLMMFAVSFYPDAHYREFAGREHGFNEPITSFNFTDSLAIKILLASFSVWSGIRTQTDFTSFVELESVLESVLANLTGTRIRTERTSTWIRT